MRILPGGSRNRLRTIAWVAILAAALVPFAAAAGGGRRSAHPDVTMRMSPLSDFYFTLRAATQGDTAQGLPVAMRAAARRLKHLTEFLPDSLPLKTPQNTVLIVHKKNPKYTAHVERLLWRRLDPTLGTLRSAEELPRVLTGIAAALQPVCGLGADSIREALSELYKSSYPLFLTTTWPGHMREGRAWRSGIEKMLASHQREALAYLSKKLAMPMADSSQVQVWIVPSGVPEEGLFHLSDDKSTVAVILRRGGDGYAALAGVWRAYLRGCEMLLPESAPAATKLLARALGEAKADPLRTVEIERMFVDYCIERMIAEIWSAPEPARATPGEKPHIRSVRDAWDAYLAGKKTLDQACRAMAAAGAVSFPSTGPGN